MIETPATYGKLLIETPLVSIVIALKDAAADLRVTLASILPQSFRNYEIIIADAYSNDHPDEVIADFNLPIRHFVQKDAGIYDAWNKVLLEAQGDWILFFGAGDTFFNEHSLGYVAQHLIALPASTAIAYGKVVVKGENDSDVEILGRPWADMKDDIISFGSFPHQAMFHRRASFDIYGLFDRELTIAADADMLLRVSSTESPAFMNLVVARFAYGGISSQAKSRLKAYRQRTIVLKRHKLFRGYVPAYIKAYALYFAFNFLSKHQVEYLIDLFRRLSGRRSRYRS